MFIKEDYGTVNDNEPKYTDVTNDVVISSNKAFVDTNIIPNDGMIIVVMSGSVTSYSYYGCFMIKNGEIEDFYSNYISLRIVNNKIQVKQTFSSSSQSLRVITIE